MATHLAKIKQTTIEKRYATLNLLESAYVSGNKVQITPVSDYELTQLSSEVFDYGTAIITYVILDERPKIQTLYSYGWYREGQEVIPMIASIPTHLVYDKETGFVVNEMSPSVFTGDIISGLINTGETADYELRPLNIVRGTLVDIYYDFMPNKINRFMVGRVFLDTVSLWWKAELIPYKYPKESTPSADENTNTEYIKFDSNKFGI